MRRDQEQRLLNPWIVTAVYCPISVFSWMLQMASDGIMDATNLLYIQMIEIFCGIAFAIPFLCVGAAIATALCRKKGYWILSWVVEYLPLAVFVLNLILLGVTELVPAVV